MCANAAELPFPDGEFDLVTHFTCLSSVLDPGLRAAIAAEMWRVVRPGGVVLSFDMRPAPWPEMLVCGNLPGVLATLLHSQSPMVR